MSSRYWSVTDCCWRSSTPGPDPEAERWTSGRATADALAATPDLADAVPATPDLADAVPAQRADAEPATA